MTTSLAPFTHCEKRYIAYAFLLLHYFTLCIKIQILCEMFRCLLCSHRESNWFAHPPQGNRLFHWMRIYSWIKNQVYSSDYPYKRMKWLKWATVLTLGTLSRISFFIESLIFRGFISWCWKSIVCRGHLYSKGVKMSTRGILESRFDVFIVLSNSFSLNSSRGAT